MGLHRLCRVKVPMWITRFKTLVEWTGCWIPQWGSMGLDKLWRAWESPWGFWGSEPLWNGLAVEYPCEGLRVWIPMRVLRFRTLVEWSGHWMPLWGSKGVNPHEGSEVRNPHGASKVLVWLLQADTPAGVWIGSTGLSSYGILRVRTPVDWTGMSMWAG